MELYKTMEDRRSVRSYRPDPVPEASLERILQAIQIAPSWKNRQAWHVILVKDRAKIEEIGALLKGNPRGVDFHTLPMLVLLAMDPAAVDTFDGKEYYLVDAGIAGEHLVLAAQAEGLGTCWIGWFYDAPIKKALGIPDSYRLVMITPLGYPAGESKAQPRKALSEFVHEGGW